MKMKVLYLECNAGVSGDMLLGALSNLLEDPKEFEKMIASAGIPDVEAIVEKGEKSHISGTRAKIIAAGQEEGDFHDHHIQHRTLQDVLDIIKGLNVSDWVKEHATAIYKDMAEAESKVHGESVAEIHFHEVGMLDAIADIVGSCMLMERLAPEYIVSSELRTGYGNVECAHGLLPIPAPATALLLRGVPSYAGDLEGEFTTPTGAAIIRHFAEDYGQRPKMVIDEIGVGLGRKDFSIPNIIRAFIGESDNKLFEIYEINCNIDDMTPEDLGSMIDMLLEQGALDATISQTIMKKGRPGQRLTCLCRQDDKERLAKLILENTSTIGLRIWKAERFEMASHMEVCHTQYGDIRVKVSEGYGIRKWKPEHDDLLKAAEAHGVTVRDVRAGIRFDPDQ
ncbi:nickel pincer cofactor biosynthesis protein LarC [Methanomassiliicoccales archaeon LGM-RCC1]|nr:nickel pincer cofactor biosynthesis protein LarC [Methanomassiliicoccales archaeon LGM-RCC1]